MSGEKSSPQSREVLDFLMTVAANAGPDVELPRYELKGEGLNTGMEAGRTARSI